MKHKGKKKARRITRRDALRLWRGEDLDARKRRVYFGYGSNLNMAQMARRCPDSTPMVACMLPEMLLSFSDVLTIEDAPGQSVVGALYEVSAADERKLDRYEGFPHKYVKKTSHVTLNGERREVFYYVLGFEFELYTPTLRYYGIVEDGYKDWGLDLRFLEESYDRAVKAEKKARKARKLRWGLKPDGQTYWVPDTKSKDYNILPDGTIDYPAFGWDEVSDELERAFKADYCQRAGW